MVSTGESGKFFATFKEHSARIEESIANQQVEECRKLILELQAEVNAHTVMLPGRDLKIYREKIAEFKKNLDILKGPKKKFGFSRAVKESNAERVKIVKDAAASDAEIAGGDEKRSKIPVCEYGLRDKQDESLHLTDVQGDVELKNLTNCQVLISGSPATIYMSNITKCAITSQPVSSSVLIYGCTDSEIILACQQLRIHEAKNTVFRLHIIARSIIEDCSAVKFTSLPASYEAADELWQKAGYDKDSKNNYNLVDDFNWLSNTGPSPNWTLLEQ